MDIIQSQELTQRVIEIITQFFHTDSFDLLSKLQNIQSQYIKMYTELLTFLKDGFTLLREQLIQDLQPPVQKELVIQEPNEIMTLSRMSKQLENNSSLQEIQEQIKQLDIKVESQWQGLAYISDQVWEMKKTSNIISVQGNQKKRFGIF
ncbi:hypothetical protein pb186bvf_009624 [Paramecium bursaria]